MKQILKILLVSFIGFCAVAYGILLFEKYGSKTLTDSMYPTYKIGDLRFLIPFEKPKIGDVVVYKCKNESRCQSEYSQPISHRLIAVDASGCMTIVGDNPKYDWSNVPCFMPEDIEVLGVNHKLPF